MDKIKDFVKGNPEQAGGAIDKVEDLVDERTGGKYSEQIDKGTDALREQLGLPRCPSPARPPCPSRGRPRRPNRSPRRPRIPRPLPTPRRCPRTPSSPAP